MCHVGRKRTEHALRQHWWPSKYSDIVDFVSVATGTNDKGQAFGDIVYMDFVSNAACARS